MSCGCGKRKGGNVTVLADHEINLADGAWGPILWKYLHCVAEKIGMSGNAIVDTDQANYMETLLTMLPLVLPCKECQAHAATYIGLHPVPLLRGLYNTSLRNAVREWLFAFHNAVRMSKEQPILVSTVEECEALYANCGVPKCEYSFFIKSIAAAVRLGWVRIDNWRKWYSNSERVRILSGNVVV